MGFLDRLFGRKNDKGSKEYRDEHGLLVYVQCDRCGSAVRLRIDKRHDLNRSDGGFRWHKTIVDSKCFRPIPTVADFDGKYNMTNAEIDGGHFISAAEYEALTNPPPDVSSVTDTGDGAE